MGVHGLTRWIYSQSSLAESVTHSCDDDKQRVPFVLDGQAFLYVTTQSNLVWMTACSIRSAVAIIGTSQLAKFDPTRTDSALRVERDYAGHVANYISYWRGAGLEPVFVWDGPFDATKLPTQQMRSAQSLAKSLKYMSAPDKARVAGEIRKAGERLPPLSMTVCLDVLRQLAVTSFFPETEADSVTAELAQRLDGYSVSNDSDYFIFPAKCRGYVPLSQITYGESFTTFPRLLSFEHDRPVVHLRVYQPEKIARLLRLPLSYLPYFAALLGNDIGNFGEAMMGDRRKHFRPDESHVLRIAKALSTRKSMPVDTIAERTAVLTAAAHDLLGGKKTPTAAMVALLLLSAESYNLTPLELASSSFPFRPDPVNDPPNAARCRALYEEAFKQGKIGYSITKLIKHGLMSAPILLEKADSRSTGLTLGEPLRRWLFAIVDNAVGLPAPTIRVTTRVGDSLKSKHVPVEPLPKLLGRHVDEPVLLAGRTDRMRVLLQAFGWPVDALDKPDTPLWPLIVALRFIRLHLPKEWSAKWHVRAALAVPLILSSTTTSTMSADETVRKKPEPKARVPSKEAIQRMSELTMTLWHMKVLAEALLLSPSAVAVDRRRPSDQQYLSEQHKEEEDWCLWVLLDGSCFHALLEGGKNDPLLKRQEIDDALQYIK